MPQNKNFENQPHQNTKSPTLELIVKSYFDADSLDEEGAEISYNPKFDAEEIKFSSDKVTATVLRPALDTTHPELWQCPWDKSAKLSLRMFFQGNLGNFTFNGLHIDTIEIDMGEDGELRPVIDDPRGAQIGEPVSERDILGLITTDVVFVNNLAE